MLGCMDGFTNWKSLELTDLEMGVEIWDSGSYWVHLAFRLFYKTSLLPKPHTTAVTTPDASDLRNIGCCSRH